MKSIWKFIKITSLLAATALLILACGGGGDEAPARSTTLTGTAAAGAPIIGTVTIKDSTTPTAQTKTVTIEANGKYTVLRGPRPMYSFSNFITASQISGSTCPLVLLICFQPL